MIRVTDLAKAYRDLVAVEALGFRVGPGEVLGLVGPNGAGKTTTLRCLAGVIPPTSGGITIAGHDLARDEIAAKSGLAYIPDDPRLFDALTVWEHLEFIASAYRVHDWRGHAEALLDRFELVDKRNTLAQELSRGMRQKTAICCAYLHSPRAILFDEPHTGLDPRGIRTMKASVQERVAEGAAVIVSSHLLDLVEGMCTHLLILHRGRSLYFGRVEEARAAFPDLSGDASLEEVFFRVTEGNGGAEA